MDFKMVNAGLEKMSESELRMLNSNIVTIIRAKMARKTAAIANQFRPGNTVSFSDKGGRRVKMQVDRINTKSIGGTELNADGTLGYRKWRVHPSFCVMSA